MATKEIIDLGSIPNDNTGDTLRIAGAKINSNFNALFSALGTSNELLFDIDYSNSPLNNHTLVYDSIDNKFKFGQQPTDLILSTTSSIVRLSSSTGNTVNIPHASNTNAGVMTAADFVKLSSIEANAQPNEPTDLSLTFSSSNNSITLSSSTGNQVVIPIATMNTIGLFTHTEKNKLNGIQAGAQVNAPTNLSTIASPTTVTVTSSTGHNAILPVAAHGRAGVLTSNDWLRFDSSAPAIHNHSGSNITSGVVARNFGGTGHTSYVDGQLLIGNSNSNGLSKARLQAGSGISIINEPGSIRIENTRGHIQENIFKNVASSNGNVVFSATNNNDTLRFSATGITSVSFENNNRINVNTQGTDLGTTYSTSTVSITSSTGSNTTIAAVTSSTPGVMTPADKAKLEYVNDNLITSYATNLSISGHSASGLTINSSTGTGATIPLASSSGPGLMSNQDKSALAVLRNYDTPIVDINVAQPLMITTTEFNNGKRATLSLNSSLFTIRSGTVNNTIGYNSDISLKTINGVSILGSGTISASEITSDYRLKNNVTPINDSLEKIKLLNPVSFSWKEDNKNDIGFIAHELAEVLPDAVYGKKDQVDNSGNVVPQTIDQSKLIPVLVAAIQELSKTVEELRAKLT